MNTMLAVIEDQSIRYIFTYIKLHILHINICNLHDTIIHSPTFMNQGVCYHVIMLHTYDTYYMIRLYF